MTQHQRAGTLARTAMAYVLAGGRGSRLYEMTDRRAFRHQMHAGFDHRLLLALCAEAILNCAQNLVIGQGELGDILAVEEGDVDRLMAGRHEFPWNGIGRRVWRPPV